MNYNFLDIEKKWQKYWEEKETYKVKEGSHKEKYYVLDMFPYPSGEGLHVGHPLGYIASDIFARYKRLKGYNVLHPMGFDSFGLPTEQYAIQTGIHPSIATKDNIERYRKQLNLMGILVMSILLIKLKFLLKTETYHIYYFTAQLEQEKLHYLKLLQIL